MLIGTEVYGGGNDFEQERRTEGRDESSVY